MRSRRHKAPGIKHLSLGVCAVAACLSGFPGGYAAQGQTPSYPVPPPTIDVVSPPPGSVFSDACYLTVTGTVDFEDYTVDLGIEDFDFMFVLDRSGSMTTSDPDDLTKQAALEMLDTVPAEVSMKGGVVTFGSPGRLHQELTLDRTQLRDSVVNLPDQNGGTDIPGAITIAGEEFDARARPDIGLKFIILVSDGESNTDGSLEAAAKVGLPIHTFHIGSVGGWGDQLMQDLADQTGGTYHHVEFVEDLPIFFSEVVNIIRYRVTRVELISDAEPGRVYRAAPWQGKWKIEAVPVDGNTSITVTAITNENPPRHATFQFNIYIGYNVEIDVDVEKPLPYQIVYSDAINLEGTALVSPVADTRTQSMGEVLPADLPTTIVLCQPRIIDRVLVRTNATPDRTYRAELLEESGWSIAAVPVRSGPDQVTSLTVTAYTDGDPSYMGSKSLRVISARPCAPIVEVLPVLDHPVWETPGPIEPFDFPDLLDVSDGMKFSMPGPLGRGYFGIVQTRDFLCPTVGGVNVLRVYLDPDRSGTAPLPDCRIRIFQADNSESYFCRVNELVGVPFPPYVDVPFMSDGKSSLRIAVDLMAFNESNLGGWTFRSPLELRSAWAFRSRSLAASASAATFVGEMGGELSGTSLAAIGDVNRDGYDDFVIGARQQNHYGQEAGCVYLIEGKPTGWKRWENLFLTPQSFVGEAPGDLAGFSASAAGDVNGDGFDDFLIGAPYNAEGGSDAGKVYLFLGRREGWGPQTSLASADATFLGEAPGGRLGHSVAGVGDVNGDGLDDFLLAAPYFNNGLPGAGKCYLLFGRETGWQPGMPLSSANASFVGEAAGDHAGFAVSPAGDVDGNSLADFLIGAPHSDQSGLNAGTIYLIYGKTLGWVRNFPLVGANWSIQGESAGDTAGTCLAAAGDANGDGLDDFLIGAPENNHAGEEAGKAYLVLGRTRNVPFPPSLDQADASFLGEQPYDRAGFSVDGAGDVNADGYDDILIGSIWSDAAGSDSGKASLILGRPTGWSPATPLASTPFSYSGEKPQDLAGYRVRGVGDVNGDGVDDFAVSAPTNQDGGEDAGQTYLIFGSPDGPIVAPLGRTAATVEDVQVRAALLDLNESSWEPWPQIFPFQQAILTDPLDGLKLAIREITPKQFFAFYQTRDSFPPLTEGLHLIRVHLEPDTAPGFLLPDIRCRVFHADNSISFFSLFTEASGDSLPTVIEVPYLSDGVSPFRVALDILAFDSRMLGGWTVTAIELDP